MDEEITDRPGSSGGVPLLVKLVIAVVIGIILFVLLIDILGLAGYL